MKKLIKYSLDCEAVKYIENVLRGGRTLSRYLLECLDLNKGKVVTFLPEGIQDIDIKNFEVGGKLKVPTETIVHKPGTIAYPIPITDSFLAEIVQTSIFSRESGVCILEDATRSPRDMFKTSVDDQMLVLDDEVYYLLTKKNIDKEMITKTISVANSLWHFVCVMTSWPNKPEKKNISNNDIKDLVKKTEKLAIGAYDGEGYLIWAPN